MADRFSGRPRSRRYKAKFNRLRDNPATIVVLGILARTQLRAEAPRATGISKGATVALREVDFHRNGSTLLLVLKRGCPFCEQSASFYQELLRSAVIDRQPKVIVVMNEPTADAQGYLASLGLSTEVVRDDAHQLGVRGFPTLVLVDTTATVVKVWRGKLDVAGEKDVRATLRQSPLTNVGIQ